MPGIFKIECFACGYSVRGSESITVAVMPDGSEEICGHPLEKDDAEELTGERWSTLRKSGRIRYRYALFCRDCGALDYYGPDWMLKWTHIGNIVHVPTPQEAETYKCRSCGRYGLFPVIWKRGEAKLCPKCKARELTSEMIAIS